MDLFYAEDLESWHAWLEENHTRVKEIWLLFYKKETGLPCIRYEAAVEEALCYGWVDSLIKNIDPEKHARKFTPRNPGSRWSELNIARVERMVAQGRMTDAGLRLFREAASQKKEPGFSRREELENFRRSLLELLDTQTRSLFETLPPSLQRQYSGWVMTAKKPETRQKRIDELSWTLKKGERLGMK